MKNPTKYLLTLLTFLCVLKSNAQTYQLDQFDKKKAFSSSGGINFSQIFYTPMGGEQRRLPYTYNFSGNLTATVFGFSFPFSFNISNQQTNYRQPFNQIKIAPKYKWVQLHLGNSSMNFSPLTLAGHNFNGYGVDLTPEKFKLSAMYGTLLQAIAIDTLNANNIASFKRTGFGLKFGTKLAKGNIEVIGFGAYDDPNSIPLVDGFEEALKPESNLVFSIKPKDNQKTFGRCGMGN